MKATLHTNFCYVLGWCVRWQSLVKSVFD